MKHFAAICIDLTTPFLELTKKEKGRRKFVDILRYIGKGCESAVTREQLTVYTGCPDRAVRYEIERLRNSGILIINIGQGYFIPEKSDYALVEQFERSLHSYIKSISILVGAIRNWKKEHAKSERTNEKGQRCR